MIEPQPNMEYKTEKIRNDMGFENVIDQLITDGWAIWFMTPVRSGTYYITFCRPHKVI